MNNKFQHDRAYRVPVAAMVFLSLCIAAATPSLATAAKPIATTQPAANSDSYFPTETPIADCGAKYIRCLAANQQGEIFVGTEDQGFYVGKPTGDGHFQWTQHTGAELGGSNSVYAVAVDRKGRAWLGTDHGVTVMAGDKFQSYSVIADPGTNTLAGPLGARIFAIATSPVDGDIWISTDAGLSRYSLAKDTWIYRTRGDGLPSDQIASIAFTKAGRILLASQCDGVATAELADDYKTFRCQRGPDLIPVAPTGDGLPTNLTNSIIVGRNGTVYLGTTTGLAFSKDGGDSWQYIRGKEYAEKARGLLYPRGLVLPSAEVFNALLSEDVVTNVSEDSAGHIWLGHRATGYEVIDPASSIKFSSKADPKITEKNNYVTAILTVRNTGILPVNNSGANPQATPARRDAPRFTTYIARYGAGLTQFNPNTPVQAGDQKANLKLTPGGLFLVPDDGAPDAPSAASAFNAAAPPPALPLRAKPPTADELEALLAKMQALPKANFTGMFLGEDHCTLGDWLGRYGQQGGVLCGAGSPADHPLLRNGPIKINSEIGPHARKDDGVRLWIHWPNTDNPKCLYDPVLGHRIQSEWDDHGETYSDNFEGPDIWIKVTVPDGVHRISLYFMNKDGQTQDRWTRDFDVTLKVAGKNYAETDALPILASTRVTNFWGGVYKQFVVGKAGIYFLKIQRNYTFDALVSAVFIDRLKGPPVEGDQFGLPWMGLMRYTTPDPGSPPSGLTAAVACALWGELEKSCDRQGAALIATQVRILCYRAAMADGASENLLANWRWKMAVPWSAKDRAKLEKFEQDAYTAEQKREDDSYALTLQVMAQRKTSGVPRFAPGVEKIANPKGWEDNQKLYGP